MRQCCLIFNDNRTSMISLNLGLKPQETATIFLFTFIIYQITIVPSLHHYIIGSAISILYCNISSADKVQT